METAIGQSEAALGIHRGAWRGAARTVCALAVSGLCLAFAPVALASASSYTWTGTSTITEAWSEPENWAGDSAPKASSALETLTFPRLTSAACTTEPKRHPCYISGNDITGLSTETLQLDDGDSYYIFGEELELGRGGLDATPASGSSGEAGDFLEMPLTLGATQKWSVGGRSEGLAGETGLLLTEPVTGPGKALTVELSDKPVLFLANSTEVGPIAIEGQDADEAGVFNGITGLLEGELNSSDREPVELSHIFFIGDGALGRLSTSHSELFVGSGGEPALGLEAASVKLDPASEVAFDITGEGSTAEEDYSQLTSTGAIELEGSELDVEVSPPKKEAACPTLHTGQVYTLLSTTGTLSGAFSNAPQDTELPISFVKACKQPTSQKLKISYQESGATQTVTATVESGEKAPEVTRDPSSVEVVKGEEATFEAAASGVPTPTVQWELSKNDGGTWNTIAGATSDTEKVSSTKTSESGDEYRAVFTNAVGKAETTAATLTVRATPVAPEVTKNPVSVEVLEGQEATFEAAASGAPAPSVQWELSTNKGATWSPVGGATSDVLKVPGTKISESGDEYRAVFTNSVGKAETTAAVLTVESQLEHAEKEAIRKKQEEEAIAKKRQEEEAAKVGVLSAKEGSPDATIAGTSLRASASGAVNVKISCPAGVSSCAGTVTLRTLNAVVASSAGAAKAKAAVLTLASGSFDVPGGGSKTVTLHLSAKARALLARLHTVRVRATILAHDPTGGTHTWRTTLTLRAPKPKHGKG